MIDSIFVGQIEVTSYCDLVDIQHREPVQHPVTHTFTGRFESKRHWTALTPDNARKLAAAITTVAESWGDYHNNGTHDGLARRCYGLADAMIRARDKGALPPQDRDGASR